jgi:HYR domain
MRSIRFLSTLALGLAAGGGGGIPVAHSSDSAPRPVLATANIFGAGYSDAPEPGGGGGGTLPPGWRLPEGSARVVAFPSVTGMVSPIESSYPFNGPEGVGDAGSTDIETWRGISGILDGKNGMFLVGVFLADDAPMVPAPPRLDFTAKERFATLAPLIGQTFFIGDGNNRRYEVPATASRLYLGFADAYNGMFWHGQPGYFGNNRGHLDVVASGVLDGPGLALDTSAPALSGAGNVTVNAPRGKRRARVSFFVRATDAVDGIVPVACTRRSGSFFKLGRTKVSCSATDSSANTGTASFTVTVKRSRR